MERVQNALQKLRSSEANRDPSLYSASDDGTLREWSHSGELLRTFVGEGGVQCVQAGESADERSVSWLVIPRGWRINQP
eukprot:Skav230572  [mRNA]  locus=scaffold971:148714:152455:- [translate_table: standard]